MYSIRELYRIGHGPSSSHTMGPAHAAVIFRQRYPQARAFRVYLFGSLAATGVGHLTDVAIGHSLAPLEVNFIWQPEQIPTFHPNGMRMEALDSSGQVIGDWEVYSVGGGALRERTKTRWLPEPQTMYTHKSMRSILKNCVQNGKAFWEYVADHEDPEIWNFMREVWDVMQATIKRGLHTEGVLPGGLGISRKAWVFYRQVSVSGRNFMNE